VSFACEGRWKVDNDFFDFFGCGFFGGGVVRRAVRCKESDDLSAVSNVGILMLEFVWKKKLMLEFCAKNEAKTVPFFS
jgi:hypothetical protein